MNATQERTREDLELKRSVEREVEIRAPVEAVWKALTDAEELTRWFPLDARVEPGPGGTVWTRWTGEGFSEDRIRVWEPNRHLGLEGARGSWAQIATDYYLEGRAGSTILRVVSSGFGEGADWDYMAGSFSRGWDFELRGLKHYLESHAGEPRLFATASQSYDCSDQEAWESLTRSGAWFGEHGLGEVASGDRVTIQAGPDDVLEGTVELWQAPDQLVVKIDGWNGALFRLQTCYSSASVWLFAHGAEEEEIEALSRRWQASFPTHVPA